MIACCFLFFIPRDICFYSTACLPRIRFEIRQVYRPMSFSLVTLMGSYKSLVQPNYSPVSSVNYLLTMSFIKKCLFFSVKFLSLGTCSKLTPLQLESLLTEGNNKSRFWLVHSAVSLPSIAIIFLVTTHFFLEQFTNGSQTERSNSSLVGVFNLIEWVATFRGRKLNLPLKLFLVVERERAIVQIWYRKVSLADKAKRRISWWNLK